MHLFFEKATHKSPPTYASHSQPCFQISNIRSKTPSLPDKTPKYLVHCYKHLLLSEKKCLDDTGERYETLLTSMQVTCPTQN